MAIPLQSLFASSFFSTYALKCCLSRFYPWHSAFPSPLYLNSLMARTSKTPLCAHDFQKYILEAQTSSEPQIYILNYFYFDALLLQIEHFKTKYIYSLTTSTLSPLHSSCHCLSSFWSSTFLFRFTPTAYIPMLPVYT